MDRLFYRFMFIIAAYTVLPQSVYAQDMMSTVNKALANYPAVQELQEKAASLHQQTIEAKGGYYPSVTIQMKRGPEMSDNPTLVANGNSDEVLFRAEDTLTATQTIFNGGQTYYAVANRRHLEQSHQHALHEKQQEIAFDNIEAYLNVLRHRKLVALSEKNLTTHTNSYHKIDARTESGLGHRADRELAEARLAFARTQLSQSKQNLADANGAFLRLFDHKAGKLVMPSLPNIPNHLSGAMQVLLEKNPTLKFYDERIKADHDLVHVVQADFIPHVNVEGTMYRSRNRQGSKSFDHNARVMLDVSYTPINGGSDVARLNEAKYELRAEKRALDEQERILIDEISALYDAEAAYTKRIHVLEKYVTSIEVAAKDYRKQFTIGKQDVFSLLDIEKEMHSSKASLINEKFDHMINRYKILQKLGSIPVLAQTTQKDEHV